MKTLKLLLLTIAMITSCSLTAQVAVSDNGSIADGSAMLDVQSTDKGLLPPRMTEAQRDAISNPVAGLIIFCSDCMEMQMYNGLAWVNMIGGAPALPSVYNPVTGKYWMDRNLGASQVATSSNDAAAYGDLFQWGRAAEGHESRASGFTTDLATTEVPNAGNSWDGMFILSFSSEPNWLTPPNTNLWQGIYGPNNPCPVGFRIPTEAEWEAERLSWISNDAAGAFASDLKLTVGGFRNPTNGMFDLVGTYGYYWSSTHPGGPNRVGLKLMNISAYESDYAPANGYSVRCIKD